MFSNIPAPESDDNRLFISFMTEVRWDGNIITGTAIPARAPLTEAFIYRRTIDRVADEIIRNVGACSNRSCVLESLRSIFRLDAVL